jgi:hypothetical protein
MSLAKLSTDPPGGLWPTSPSVDTNAFDDRGGEGTLHEGPVGDDSGSPLQRDGSSTVVPGLHFMGVHFQRKRKSATFLGVAEDAAVLAERMAATR